MVKGIEMDDNKHKQSNGSSVILYVHYQSPSIAMLNQTTSKPHRNITPKPALMMHNLLPSSWLSAFMDEVPKVEEVRRETARSYHLPKVRQKLGEKKMVHTSSGLVTHIPCFNHSTTRFHTWMLTRRECGSREKTVVGLQKIFSHFLSIFREKEVACAHHLEHRGLWSIATRATNTCWAWQA